MSWIKMRGNLWDDPRVSKLCDLTGQTEAAVIGGLYWLWASADQHTEDGCMPGLTLRQIDRKTGIAGFGAALCEIDWIADDAQGIVIRRFEEHNGASAKRRATDAHLKAKSRSPSAPCPHPMRTEDGQDADKTRHDAELEKDKRKNKEKDNPVAALPPPSGPKPQKRCPEDFIVSPELLEWAALKAPHVDVAGQTEAFRDWTFRDAKTDWPATWRSWMRKAAQDGPGPPRTRPKSFREHDIDAQRARIRELTGGLLDDRGPKDGIVIDMETGHAIAIATR